MQRQESSSDGLRPAPPPPSHAQASGAAAAPFSISADFLQAALSDASRPAAGGGGATAAASVATTNSAAAAAVGVEAESSRERFATQLASLADMGIADEEVALQALEASNGDLNMAVSILFG